MKWSEKDKAWLVERITIHVKAWLYSPRSGWITTGRRTFVWDDLPVVGEPRKLVVGPSPGQEQKAQKRKVISDTITDLSATLTRFATYSFDETHNDMVARMVDDVARLKVACPPLIFHLDKIAAYISNPDPRDGGYVQQKLITPLIFDAQQFIAD
jgi:hypothetical protein